MPQTVAVRGDADTHQSDEFLLEVKVIFLGDWGPLKSKTRILRDEEKEKRIRKEDKKHVSGNRRILMDAL